MTDKKHAHASHADTPATADTARKLVEKLGLTEREAQALLAVDPPTDAQVQEAAKVNLHAIGAAFSAATVTAINADKKLTSPVAGDALSSAALHVRTMSSASDKLQAMDRAAHASSRVEANALANVEKAIVPEIRARANVDASVKETFAAILAYHHARNPGHHHHAATEAPSPPVNAPST
jgi:hypothetical protein